MSQTEEKKGCNCACDESCDCTCKEGKCCCEDGKCTCCGTECCTPSDGDKKSCC